MRRTTKHRQAESGVSKAEVTSKVTSSNGTSQSSVNNDWTNWLVLHGNDKVLSEDVCEIGRTVGLNFSGDKNNMFDVLSGVGRKNREGGGEGAALVCVSSDEAFILEYSGVGQRREKAGGELFGEGEKTFYSLYPRN